MIVDIAEIAKFLGKDTSLTKQEEGLLSMLQTMVEQAVKDIVRCNIEQTTVTHILQARSYMPVPDRFSEHFEIAGQRAISQWGRFLSGNSLQVIETPLRAVTILYEDWLAYGGDFPNAFASNTALTEGKDYWVDWEIFPVAGIGLCRSGKLNRIVGTWPAMDRSIKVTCTAGYARNELDGDPAAMVNASPIKHVILEAMALSFNASLQAASGASGPITREKLDQWETWYDAKINGWKCVIPPSAGKRLQRYINYNRFM